MNILLADPDRDMLLCYARLLELAGNEAVTAFDAAGLVGRWEENRPDLIILNTDLPGLDRNGLAAKAAADPVPLLMLGLSRTAPAPGGGFPSAYLAYPFRPEELLQQIDLLSGKGTIKVNDHE